MMQGLMLLAPIFIIAIVVALLGNYVQVGFLFTRRTAQDEARQNQSDQGFKHIFSMHSLVEFVKNILKLLLIGFIVYFTTLERTGPHLELVHRADRRISSVLSPASPSGSAWRSARFSSCSRFSIIMYQTLRTREKLENVQAGHQG